jgi:hypothetical protein
MCRSVRGLFSGLRNYQIPAQALLKLNRLLQNFKGDVSQ